MSVVNRGRRLKRHNTYGRRQYRKTKNKSPLFKLSLLIGVVLFAFALKYVDKPPITTIREFISENLGGGEAIKDTVAVIGKAVIGENGLWGSINNAAVKVFNADKNDDNNSKDVKENTSSATVDPKSLPAISPNVFDEMSPESTGDNLSAGAFSAQQLVYKKEEKLKEIGAESFAKYGFGLSETELPDGINLLLKKAAPTAKDQKSFQILPTLPSNVDGKKYKLPFSCSAPLNGVITSPFGERTDPLNSEDTFHHGVDIGVPAGTVIKCFAQGKVIDVGSNSIYGKYVRVQHSGGFTSFYAHCSKIYVKIGQKVKLGQKLAISGSTGRATGPHLHFELRRNNLLINPSNYVKLS
ncbi:MAG: M23 family metallopeptidase [Clostridiales bacterium]|nr:M23 family metallopeptidase [Clostridiales bacterium]